MKRPPRPKDPFITACVGGHWCGPVTAGDRIELVKKSFTVDDCIRALRRKKTLQGTVVKAVEIRLRQLNVEATAKARA